MKCYAIFNDVNFLQIILYPLSFCYYKDNETASGLIQSIFVYTHDLFSCLYQMSCQEILKVSYLHMLIHHAMMRISFKRTIIFKDSACFNVKIIRILLSRVLLLYGDGLLTNSGN